MEQELKGTSPPPPTLNRGKQDLGTPETTPLDICETSAPLLRYYRPELESMLEIDASDGVVIGILS
jgi:hypothetical protein